MMTRLLVLVASLAVVGVLSQPAVAQQDEIALRLQQLEAQTQTLQQEVQWLREHPARLPATDGAADATQVSMAVPNAVPVPAAVPVAPGDTQYFTIDELRGEMKKLVWTKGDLKIVPYGYLWGNMVYETERTNVGSHTFYVFSSQLQGENNFVVDGRNTRLGLDVAGPDIPFFCCAHSGGKVEIDFQGTASGTDNKGSVLLRHAYCEVKNDEFRLLAGQTWDVISPLVPGMLMYSVGWGGGNIGYRRAQLRGERYIACSDCTLLTLQGSLNQNITYFDANIANPKGIVGESSGWPLLEGRTAITLGQRTGPDALPVTFGFSGHIGEEGFDLSTTPGDEDIRRRTWSLNADWKIPVTTYSGFQGEFFTGENLGAFLGGVLQGIDPITLNTIRSTGGWAEYWHDWTPAFHSHFGYSIDDPNNGDVSIGGRTYNQFYYGNFIYDLTKQFLIGVEVSSWKTLYNGLAPGESLHTEFVARYGF